MTGWRNPWRANIRREKHPIPRTSIQSFFPEDPIIPCQHINPTGRYPKLRSRIQDFCPKLILTKTTNPRPAIPPIEKHPIPLSGSNCNRGYFLGLPLGKVELCPVFLVVFFFNFLNSFSISSMGINFSLRSSSVILSISSAILFNSLIFSLIEG